MPELEWVFETDEQVEAFLKLAHMVPKDRGPIVRCSRNPLRVFMVSDLVREFAKGFQFGWMAYQEASKSTKETEK